MTTTINASTSAGLINTADTSGILQLQTAGTAAVTIDASQNVGIGLTSLASKFTVAHTSADPSISAQGNAALNLSGSSSVKLFAGTASSAPYGGWIQAADGGSQAYALYLNPLGGNVGIGTTSPGYKLQVSGVISSNDTVRVSDGTTTTIMSTAGTGEGTIGTSSNHALQFRTNNTERMRIDSSGNLLVGNTSQAGRVAIQQTDAGNPGLRIYASSSTFADNAVIATADRNTTNNSFYFFSAYNNTATAYKFRVADSGNCTNTNNSYGAISDAKLKENIADATPKLADLMQVKVRNYNMIGDTQKQIGVVAQELEEVFPGMVDESPDQDAEGNDLGTTTKSVKYSVFVPMLIKSLQELKQIVDAQAETLATQAAEIAALKESK